MTKRRKPKRVHIPGVVMLAFPTTDEIERFSQQVYFFELLVEETLPKGKCTLDDLQTIIDFTNLAALILARPKSRYWLNEEAIAEVIPEAMRAIQACTDLFYRAQKTGAVVCTGEELEALRGMSWVAGEVIHRSLKECPMLLFKEFYVMDKLLYQGEVKTVPVNRKQFDELVRTEWKELKNRFGRLQWKASDALHVKKPASI